VTGNSLELSASQIVLSEFAWRAALKKDGWYSVAEDSGVSFADLCRSLGRTVAKHSIYIDARSKKIVSRPDPIPFHTDSSHVDFIVWKCTRGESGGDIFLKDTQNWLLRCDENAKSILSNVMLRDPGIEGLIPPRETSLLSVVHGEPRVFYAPWLLIGGVHAPVVKRATVFLDDVREGMFSRVPMSAGTLLAIDNRRILHARGRLPDDSKRRLERAWIVNF
jgi:hypothetical protein